MAIPDRPSTAARAGSLLGVLALTGLTLVGLATGESPVPLALDLAAAALVTAILPWLLRRPVPSAALLGALVVVSPAATPAASAATLVVARTTPFRTAALVAAGGAAAQVVQGGWRPMPGLSLAWWALLISLAYVALLGWGALSQARAQVLAALRERAARAEAERDRAAEDARAQERNRLAREMHDVLAHRLSLVATYAGALEFRPDSSPEQVSRAAGVVRDGVHLALDELRDVIGVLRYEAPDAVRGDARPSYDDLPRLVAETRATGTPVQLTVDVAGEVPDACGRTIYRVVQEGLTNARKHAAGAPVRVSVSGRGPDGMTVSVRNPAAPGHPPAAAVPPPPGGSMGLVGLEERARLVGGRLRHGREDRDFVLQAWLPWK